MVKRITETKSGHEGEETNLEPITEGMATFRSRERQSAASEIVDILLSQENMHLVGHIIMNSMRNLCTNRKPSDKEATEFVEALDIIILKEFMQGVIDANKEVFGPLGERVPAIVKGALTKIEESQQNPETSNQAG